VAEHEAALNAALNVAEAIRLLWHRKRLLGLGGLVGVSLGLIAGYTLPPRFQSEGYLLVRSAAMTTVDNEKAFDSTAVNEAVVNTTQDILTSQVLMRRVAAAIDLPPDWVPEGRTERLRRWLAGRKLFEAHPEMLDWFFRPATHSPEELLERKTVYISKTIGLVMNKSSSVIGVRAITRDPAISAAIVNKTMQFYMQDRTDEEAHLASAIEATLRLRLRQTRQQIADGEQHLIDLYRQPGALETAEIPGHDSRLATMQAELLKTTTDLAKLRATYSPEMAARAKAVNDSIQSVYNSERRDRKEQAATQIAITGQRDSVASLWRVSDALEARLIDLAAKPPSMNARILGQAVPATQPSFPNKPLLALFGFLIADVAIATAVLMRRHVSYRVPTPMQSW
jgi:uncharacterized protein involved in exopolysaccharide biosynthesis